MGIYLHFKTFTGWVLALLMTAVLLIPFIILAIIIKLDSKGPVLFKQRRIGKGNKEFYIYKFRTMRTDTPPDMPTHMFASAESYITGAGMFLRKSSLDELPQLFNILKGDMAFIGPRPALWNQYDLTEARTSLGAHHLRPGITGWAQVNGRDELPIADKAALDGYYARHISLGLDLKILFMTIGSVLTSRGVSEGGPGKSDVQNDEGKGGGD